MRNPIVVLIFFLMISCNHDKKNIKNSNSTSDYLKDIKKELKKEWPDNHTINLVFHGHSVPAGYFKTPNVNTFESYPFQVLRQLKESYPYAVINVINTSIGGETSIMGQKRFENQVLNHKPDVLFIDYALNDRWIGLENSRKAIEKMIERANQEGIKIILLTPSPDLQVNLSDPTNELEKQSNQIRVLAKKYNIGLADCYKKFKQRIASGGCVSDYMSQSNHPNEKGHLIITSEIMKYFIN